MIYELTDLFTPNLKFHKEGYLVIDLSVLQKPVFKCLYKEIGEATKTQQSIVASRFTDTLISPQDLNLRLKAVILPYDSFKRQFKPIDQANEYPTQVTPYQFLRKKYQSYLTIGIKIDLEHTEQFQELWKQKNVKKIKLFSFDLVESQMEKQLPMMRKYVQLLFSASKKIHFHIKVQLESVEALRTLKQQLIQYQYPIEYCILQTNLLNLIERRFTLQIEHSWEEIAFKYTKAISKYVPAAIGCLLQSYQCNEVNQNIKISSILECLNHINHRNDREQKEYKKYHNTGISSIEPLLVSLLKDYTPQEYGHFRLKGDWGIYLGQINDVLSGKYKAQDKKIFEQVSNEQ